MAYHRMLEASAGSETAAVVQILLDANDEILIEASIENGEH